MIVYLHAKSNFFNELFMGGGDLERLPFVLETKTFVLQTHGSEESYTPGSVVIPKVTVVLAGIIYWPQVFTLIQQNYKLKQFLVSGL